MSQMLVFYVTLRNILLACLLFSFTSLSSHCTRHRVTLQRTELQDIYYIMLPSFLGRSGTESTLTEATIWPIVPASEGDV
jgi:hypothetical protein